MSHFFLLGLFAALFSQPSSLLDFSFNNGSMAWNFKERRQERQLQREERRLDRMQQRQQLNSNSFSASALWFLPLLPHIPPIAPPSFSSLSSLRLPSDCSSSLLLLLLPSASLPSPFPAFLKQNYNHTSH